MDNHQHQMIEAKSWYIWWEEKKYIKIPHYVIVFENRPERYDLILINSKKTTINLKGDPFEMDEQGVLIQKRDVFFHSSLFNPLKNIKLLLLKK